MGKVSIVSPLTHKEIKMNCGDGHMKSARSAHSHCIDLGSLGDVEKPLILDVWKAAFSRADRNEARQSEKHSQTVVTLVVLLS